MTRKTAQQRQVEALIDEMSPRVRAAFLNAIQSAKNGINQAELLEALEAGDIERAVDVLRIEQSVLWPLNEAIRASYMAGGGLVTKGLPRSIAGSFGFNGSHPRAEQWTRNIGSGLIQGIQTETLEMSREVITRGLQENIGTKTVARQLTGRRVGRNRVGGFLGLTSEITDSILSGRAKLQSGDPALMREYLGLKLRDKRHDPYIKKAIEEGRAISGTRLDQIITGHQSKALGKRGQIIARNETFTAQAAARYEAHIQLVESGKVESATHRWQHGLSKEPRLDHVAMSGTVQSVGEDFVFPDGTRMSHPHDPRGGAKHSISCRCVSVYRIKIKRG